VDDEEKRKKKLAHKKYKNRFFRFFFDIDFKKIKLCLLCSLYAVLLEYPFSACFSFLFLDLLPTPTQNLLDSDPTN